MFADELDERREEHPAEIVPLEHGENVRLPGHGFFDVTSVFVEDFLAAGNDLRED
jgi:hypothetical protein